MAELKFSGMISLAVMVTSKFSLISKVHVGVHIGEYLKKLFHFIFLLLSFIEISVFKRYSVDLPVCREWHIIKLKKPVRQHITGKLFL